MMMEQTNEVVAPVEVEVPGAVETNEVEVNEEAGLDDIFKPDELELEGAEGEYQFGKYNLDKFAKKFNGFENEEVSTFITSQTEKLEELGFTQAQVDFYIQDKIDEALTREEKTSADIKAELNAKLTPKEKKQFKSSYNQLKSHFEGTELAGLETKLMSNATLVKAIQIIQSKSSPSKPSGRKSFEASGSNKVTTEAAKDLFMQKVSQTKGKLTSEMKAQYANEVANVATNKDEVLDSLKKYL